MLNLSQRNPLWADTIIGLSASDLGGNGCLITALCDIWSKFYYNPKNKKYLRPDQAVKEWVFTAIAGDSDPRYLVWSSINHSGMKFIWRQNSWKPKEFMVDPVTGEKELMGDLVAKYARHKDYGVVFQVINSKGNQHWIAVISKSFFGWACNDPWNGKRLWMAPYPYKYISGFSLIKKS